MADVKDVKKVPHFLIFDAHGKRKDTDEKKLKDTEEKKLTEQAKQNEPFRKRLEDLFAALTSIVGHTHDKSLDRLGALYLHQLIQHADILKTRDHAPPAAWLIVQPPKHHVPAREQNQDFIVGILIITPAEVPADGYDLFLWIRPAHRSSGIGEKIMDENIVDLYRQLIDLAKQQGVEGNLKIHVRYPATGVRVDDWSRNRWFSFFALHDFMPDPEHELEPGEEWVLSRQLKEH